MGWLEFKENVDCMVIDVAFGSSRNWRMGGWPLILPAHQRRARKCISWTYGSVTILANERVSMYQLAWNTTETFTSPGSCSNVSKRSIIGL
jgi:cephalosporin-C deacetylase-like acetyl esterase